MNLLESLQSRAEEVADDAYETAIAEFVRRCESSGFEPKQQHVEAYVTLAKQGRYAMQALARDPAALQAIVDHRGVQLDTDAHRRLLEPEAARAESLDQLYAVLRRHKRIHTLRVFLREVEQVASVRQTASEIATIAEVTLGCAVDNVARIEGLEDIVDDFVVLGMGKLGGDELNFSSDVDLILICSDDVAVDPEQMRRVDQLARGVVRAMDHSTPDGYVFRVDLRLRPEGSQGPLVPSKSAFVAYYLSWGRTWERSAMLKARPVAGNLALGADALASLEPFIYRRYLDYEAIQELRSMKSKIHEHAQVSAVVGLNDDEAESAAASPAFGRRRTRTSRRRGGGFGSRRDAESSPKIEVADLTRPDPRGVRGWDVKIGVGGIREIEFFVQALQLVHCGTRPGLRVKNTLDALDRLLYGGLLSHEDHAHLADAYDFFRRLEHRIQMADDRQTHRVPKRTEDLETLAERMAFETADELSDVIVRHRDATRTRFDRLFSDDERDEASPTLREGKPTAAQTVLGAPVESLFDDAVLRALSTLGYERPRQVAGQVQILREKRYGPFSSRPAADDLGRYLLEVAASAPDADQAFSYLTRFVTTVGDRPGYYRMLSENPHATRLLAHVFGSSGYLANPLLQDPNVFERLLAVGTFAIMRTSADLEQDMRRRLRGIEDPAHRLGVIRRFHQEETLRIGIHETGGAATIEQTTQQLSLLAQTIVTAVLDEIYEPLRTRRRRPGSVLPELSDIPFAVVAMGKLGGEELGFGSDLDILFLYEEDRQWKLEHTFFARIAQRLVRTLSTASAQGKLYEVDTRLRPSGNQGALVVSAEALDNYHRDEAATWERQALLRARPILGPERLLQRIAKIRWDHAVGPAAGLEVRAEVAEMRDKLLENLRPSGTDDVKFSPGGLVDIEFLVQSIQLERAGGDFDEERDPKRVERSVHSASTRLALNALSEEEGLGFDARQLHADYLWLRRVEARLRMTDQRGSSELPPEGADREVLARRIGFQGDLAGTSFSAELAQVFDRVRRARDAYFSA